MTVPATEDKGVRRPPSPVDAAPRSIPGTMQGRAGGPRPAPRIVTERLVLRGHDLGDWPGYRDVMISDRAVHMGGPFGLNAAWTGFLTDMTAWGVTGTGGLAITTRDGRTVGQVVLNDLPGFPELELGWMMFAGCEGRGVATEAAAAFLAWIRTEIRPAALVSYVSPGNAASIAVARKLGAVRDAAARRPEAGDLVFRYGMGGAA